MGKIADFLTKLGFFIDWLKSNQRIGYILVSFSTFFIVGLQQEWIENLLQSLLKDYGYAENAFVKTIFWFFNVIISLTAGHYVSRLFEITSKFIDSYNDRTVEQNQINSELSNICNELFLLRKEHLLLEKLNNLDKLDFVKSDRVALIEDVLTASNPENETYQTKIETEIDEYIEKFKSQDLWRVIISWYLKNHIESLRTNDFTIPLEVYLNMLLDINKLCLRIDGKFVMYSFTNATPLNWFDTSSNKQTDEMLQKYREDLSMLISQFGKGNILNRYVLTSQADNTHLELNLKSYNVIFNQWSQLKQENNGERAKEYLKLHIDNEAYLLGLSEDIHFTEDFSEFIYLGYKPKNKDIIWKWCFGCSFAENSKSVGVTFYHLYNQKDSDFLIINKDITPYRENVRDITTLKKTLKELPDFLTTNRRFVKKTKLTLN